MHQANDYLKTLFPTTPAPSIVTSRVLNGSEAFQARSRLQNDAVSYIYSAAVTLGDAIGAIQNELLTWATVKLYYSTFYACRALLALNGICVFYVGEKPKPYTLEVKPGNRPEKAKAQTHKVILNQFVKQNTVPYLLSQDIESSKALDWLMEKREEANYRNAKFWEPTIPKHFEKIVAVGVRRVLNEYLSDTTGLYLFDPDHAMLAYPLSTLKYAFQKLDTFTDLALSDDDLRYLRQLFRDQDGPIPGMYDMMV